MKVEQILKCNGQCGFIDCPHYFEHEEKWTCNTVSIPSKYCVLARKYVECKKGE